MTAATPRQWELELRAGGVVPVSANGQHGSHWKGTNARRLWRTLTRQTIRAAAIPPLGRARMVLLVSPPDRRRRDEDNLVPYLLKPVKDGVVDAGVVPDDTADYLTWEIRLTEPTGQRRRWAYRLLIQEVIG